MNFNTNNHTPMAEGGEGYIYDNGDQVIKVFKPHISWKSKERKIDALMNEILPQSIIKPIEKVYDNRGTFL